MHAICFRCWLRQHAKKVVPEGLCILNTEQDVQKGMHPDLIEYMGMTKFHPMMVDWLAQFDDGAILEVGTQPK